MLAAKYPQHLIERGLRRRHWLQRWRDACKARNATTDRAAAERICAEAGRVEPDLKISVRSLARWHRAFRRLRSDGEVAGVEALVDRYGASEAVETRSPEAVEFFHDLYRTENKVSIAACHEVTVHESKRRGFVWPESYSATTAWLDKHDDRSMTFLLRHGAREWAHRYLPSLQMDYSRLPVGYAFQGDHTQLDFWCLHKSDRPIRAWLTTFQDMRSRCIVGWHIGPTPHSDAILASLRMAFRDWAIPTVMRVDNGRDFTCRAIDGYTKQERNRLRRFYGAEWQQIAWRTEHLVECDDPRWLGVTGELGIKLILAQPYAPWSKGTTERFYGTMHGRFCRLQPTYCGHDPKSRPESCEQLKRDPEAVPTIDQVRTDFAAWLDIHHRKAHKGLNGDTPLGVWSRATSLRKALADELAFLFDVRGLYKVGPNGVRVTVGSTAISFGAKSAALRRFVGRRVLIAVDGQDVSKAYAYTPDRERRQLIGRLEPNEFIEPFTNSDTVREAIAEKKREQSVMHKAARASASRTKTACQRMNEHTRRHRAELLATGTDDRRATTPAIVPVATGFESVSKADRSAFDRDADRLEEPGDIEQLFDGDETIGLADGPDDEEVMDDLYDDSEADEADEGLDGLL